MKHIFLADDDEEDRLLFEEAVKELGADVKLIMVDNGEDLITTLHEAVQIPDIIIMDVNMPKKSGFECLADIRESVKFQNIPVVILSTSFSADAIEIAFQLGADRYLSKPNSFELFKEAIKKILMLDNNSRNDRSKKEFVLKME